MRFPGRRRLRQREARTKPGQVHAVGHDGDGCRVQAEGAHHPLAAIPIDRHVAQDAGKRHGARIVIRGVVAAEHTRGIPEMH